MRGSASPTVAPAIALVFAALSHGRAARAEAPRTAALTVSRGAGTESCSAGPALARAVDARLGRKALVSLSDADLVVSARLERRGDELVARVSVEEASGSSGPSRGGTRELSRPATSCAALEEDLVLVIALTIDPDAAIREGIVPPPPPAAAPPTIILQHECVQAAPRGDPRPPPQEAARETLRLSVDAGLVLLGGTLPSLAPGFRARFGLRPRLPLWLDASATVLGTQEIRGVDGPAGARMDLAFGSLGVCPQIVATSRATALACGGLGVGSLRIIGFGLDVPRSQRRLYAETSLVGRVRFALVGPLGVVASAGVAAPLTRDDLAFVDGAGARRSLFQASAIAGTFDLGVFASLP